jgi:hypothetical protein
VGFERAKPNPEGFVIPRDSEPIGYAALVRRHELATLPNHRWSFALTRGAPRTIDHRFVLKASIRSDATDVEHLLFALKHEGVNLAILAELFRVIDRKAFEKQLVLAVRSTPIGRHHRRLWFLYEWLTDRELAIETPITTSYVPVLDPTEYFVGPDRKSPRHRVLDNLPGTQAFCPLVRKTDELATRSSTTLRTKLDALLANYDRDLLKRALSFIYTKETKSSFAIEREQPSASRTERFVSILERSAKLGDLSERVLTEIQNRIVEPRFAEDGYRGRQNYVGESITPYRQVVHYVPPKPADVPSLMNGLFEMLALADDYVADPIALAACVAFGFVFIHPFEDGNGRLHRFLVHYVLGRHGVTPENMIVPVSAVMLAREENYDATLEAFSKPIMELVEYDLDEEGRMSVLDDTARYYRYFDATKQTEALYQWLEEAIDVELRGELVFLHGLRAAKAAMREIVDLPDAMADLFVNVVYANKGRLAKRKREMFDKLSDDEVERLEKIVRTHMLPDVQP